MRNKKAFTLIELIAVLVILAILALIVTPIVTSIINKAKTSANKRSIDAYGRSIELAIASHMLDTGEIPTSIDELTIEYNGDEVVCETTQINSDSTVYLAGCTVGGKAVDGYTYGKDNTTTYTAYSVGDEVTYNNVDYYVIKDSGVKEELVTLLKAEPLTVAEVNEYGAGHVNRYTYNSVGTAYDNNGYGGLAYYTSETCGYGTAGCTTDYAQSDIKYAVDAWKESQAPQASEARLLTIDDIPNLGYEWKQTCPTCDEGWIKTDAVPDWLHNSNYWYWTSSQFEDGNNRVLCVSSDGYLNDKQIIGNYEYGVIRPVIVLEKSALN